MEIISLTMTLRGPDP